MSYESPAAILYDVFGLPMNVSGGIAVPVSTSALLNAGMTSVGTASVISVDSLGAQSNQEGAVSGSTRNTTTRVMQIGGIDAAGALQSLTVTAGYLNVTGSLSTVASGTQTVKDAGNATSTLSNVAASATSVTVLALNANRRAAIIYNDSSAKLYLKFGATASATSFTVLLFPNSYYEVPGFYTGVIDGIWATATGTARVTEIT